MMRESEPNSFIRKAVLFLVLIYISCSASATTGPQVTSISPSSGITAGGEVVTIDGFYFYGTISVDIGDSPCINVSVSQSYTSPYNGTVTCTTTAQNSGLYDVVVTNYYADPTYQTNVLRNGFQYTGPNNYPPPKARPMVWSIDPPVLLTGGGSLRGGFTVNLVDNRILSASIIYNNGGVDTIMGSVIYSDANLSFVVTPSASTYLGMPAVAFNLNGEILPQVPSTVTLLQYRLMLGSCADAACLTVNVTDAPNSDFTVIGAYPSAVPTLSPWAQLFLMISLVGVMGWSYRNAID